MDELIQLLVWNGHLKPVDIRQVLRQRELEDGQIHIINQSLRPLRVEIQRCPGMLCSNKRPYSYILVNTGRTITMDRDFGFNKNILTFVLCYIYISQQRGNLEKLLAIVDKEILVALDKLRFVEIDQKKNLICWGIKARMYFDAEDVMECINKTFSKDLSDVIKKAGTWDHSYEIFKD